jgi:hypothetical protein
MTAVISPQGLGVAQWEDFDLLSREKPHHCRLYIHRRCKLVGVASLQRYKTLKTLFEAVIMGLITNLSFMIVLYNFNSLII